MKPKMEPSPATAPKHRSFFNKLKNPTHFSKPQLLVFVLAFALIGYLLVKAFAAAPLVASVEGEQMTPQLASIPNTNNRVSDSGSAQVVLASTTKAFTSLTKPTLSGSPVVGSTIKVSNGTWSPTPSYYRYAWWRCDSSGNNCIHSPTAPPSTQNYYVVQSSDVGYTIKVQVAPNGIWTQSKETAVSAVVTAPAVAKTFGRTSIASTWTGGLNANDRFVQKFSLGDNAQVSKLSYYLKGDGTASQVAKAIIYADSNGLPATLMGQGTEVTVRGGQAAGWVNFAFANPINLIPGNYWIGLIRGGTAGTIDVATDKSGGTEAFAPDTYSDGAMNPFGSLKGTSAYSLSGYATYTLGSATASPTKIVNDSAASNGQEIELLTNVTVASSFSLPSTAASMTVMAKADQCSGVGAGMTIKVDGNNLMSTNVNSTSLTAYSANTNLAAGSHSLSISYTNDSSTSLCDRNLYVDVTNFYGPVPAPTPAPTVALSVSPTSVSAGQSATLTWSSTNATACTASGAWSGSEPTSGSLSTGALNQNSTYSLTCTGAGGSATASATITVSSVSSSGGTPGIGLNQQGGSLGLIANPSLYSLVIADAWDHLSTIENVTGRGLVYFNGTDLKQSYSTGVTYTQALNNGWLLMCGTGYCMNSQYNSYGADVGSTAYQQAWISNVLAYLPAHPGIRGIFIDNVLYDPKGDFDGAYPNKYPSTASWSAAMTSFVKAVYPALHAKGYYVALNGGAYKSGDTAYNDGTSTVNWWNTIGPYSSGLMNENYMETAQGLRANGTAWYQQWDGWQRLIGTAQSMSKDFIGLMHSTNCTNTTWMTYGKASFMLEWNGGGSVYIYSGGQCDPTNAAWTTDKGKPSGAKVQVGVGWMRTYTKGTVLVNPSSSASQTFTVNGTSYTLAPTTARIL